MGGGLGNRVQVFTVPHPHPRLHCAQATGEIPILWFLVLLTALLSLRNLKMCSLPAFPDNNKVVLKPTVWARRGPQHPTPPRPLPSVPEVMGWGETHL